MGSFKEQLYSAIESVTEELCSLSSHEFQNQVTTFLENETTEAILYAWGDESSMLYWGLPLERNSIEFSDSSVLSEHFIENDIENRCASAIKIDYSDTGQYPEREQEKHTYKELSYSDNYVFMAAA